MAKPSFSIAHVGILVEAADDRRRALYLLKELALSGGDAGTLLLASHYRPQPQQLLADLENTHSQFAHSHFSNKGLVD